MRALKQQKKARRLFTWQARRSDVIDRKDSRLGRDEAINAKADTHVTMASFESLLISISMLAGRLSKPVCNEYFSQEGY